MRKEKAMVTALTGMMILLSQAFNMLPASAQETDVISATYWFDESEILNWLDTGQYMKNNRIQGIPREPLVPYITAKILLPPYAEVAGVSVQKKFGGKHFVKDIPCGQPAVVIGEEPKIVEKDPAIYGSDELYPRKAYRVGSVCSFRGYNILHVRLYLVQYEPAFKLATYYTKMIVHVTLKTGAKMDTVRQLGGDREIATSLVDNPSMLTTYDSTFVTTETLGTTYEYIVVTIPDLADEFQVLADWKANSVEGAKVVTVREGANETEIKDVINDYYTNYGTGYVLLGGDVGVITYHTKNVMGTDIAEDYWYANLVGDDDISYYEVYIGRAPVDNGAEATQFVNKVIAYEQMEKPKANLFHQSRANPGNVPDTRELAWQCEQYVPDGYTHYEIFEEDGRIEKTDWINFWCNDGIMCEHLGHGSTTSYYINYEVGGGPVVWYNSDVASMNNTFWPVHTSVACFSGAFEYEDCLAEAYVKDPDNGAIATLMNDKYGFYASGDATKFSGDFIEMQFKSLYQDGRGSIGAMLAHSKHYFIDEATNSSDPNRPYWEWCWREINLIGDPETRLLRNLQILAEDQYGNSLTSGDVYIDDKLVGYTGSNFTVFKGQLLVFINDFWESNTTGCRYGFDHWEDGSDDNPRWLNVLENTTVTAFFVKRWCPSDVNGDGYVDDIDLDLFTAAYPSDRGDANWDSRADFDCDRDVDATDFWLFVGYMGSVYKYQLTVLAEDQYGKSLTSGDVYIDNQLVGFTGSSFMAWNDSKVFMNDFWENGTTGYRYFFDHWEDNSTTNPRIIDMAGSPLTITAFFVKRWCPSDVNGDGYVDDIDLDLFTAAYPSDRGDANWDSRADFDCDRDVDATDFWLFVGYMGSVYKYQLTVLAEDQRGNPLAGIAVYIDNEWIGYTGSNFTLWVGTYDVYVQTPYYEGSYEYTFKEWENGSKDNPRTLMIDGNTTITAFYKRK